ncbi:glycosyltransferase family 2 protein [Agrobacterium vaccinii]|uniref:glycosyltransferase family 2 protein n=1 Tax=Agrobacterium vaccinii TaxID=2735528 RepID=UPI001E457D42|nr:glycosyltransferase family A protein [Agrobacterium vaccinii]UHS63925.1 glycosyltransferase family 2 protein [Agrobacterium vaccinii]
MVNLEAVSKAIATPEAQPFFSVIIPTRNRPDYVVDTVESILAQTFENFELIISDNSDDANAAINQSVLENYLKDPRCRYVRPNKELPMVDHWEWALAQAQGKFIGFVTDRMALRLYALELTFNAITEKNADAVCFLNEGAMEFPNYRSIRKQRRKPTVRKVMSLDKATQFSKGMLQKDSPRMLNSFVSLLVIEKIRQRFGTVFSSISPDYVFSFRLMDELDSYFVLDYPLLIVQGESRSNGRAFKLGKMNSESTNFLKNIDDTQREFFKFGPISGDMFVMPNVILREYAFVLSQSDTGKLPPIDKREFYINAMKYYSGLSKDGLVSERAMAALEQYRIAHGFERIILPAKRSTLFLLWRRFIRGELGGAWVASTIGNTRLLYEKFLACFQYSRRHSARTMIEVLKKDAG